MAAHASPDIRNYLIGKGTVSFKKDGETAFRDLGNCTVFEFTPVIEKLDHFSSREGVKTKDRTAILSKSGTLKIVMEEWTPENLAIALLGAQSANTAAEAEIDIFSESAVSGVVKFTGTNDVGPKWEYTFNKVEFIPAAAITPLSDEWGGIEVNGECSAVAGSFGTAVNIGNEA